MGKCETASVAIGISIEVKDLFEAINKDNHEIIHHQLLQDNAFINDDNGCYNEAFDKILGGNDMVSDEYIDLDELDYVEYKNHIVTLFKKFGDTKLYRDGSKKIMEYKEDDEENLYHQTLLIPHCNLVSTERWGYSRYGTNGTFSILDIDKLVAFNKEIDDKMKELKISNYKISMIVCQHSG